jgi:hypothetical protein
MVAWEALGAAGSHRQANQGQQVGRVADGKTLTGAEGFTVDLSKCQPVGRRRRGSTTPTSLGITVAQSGTLAYAGYYGKGDAISAITPTRAPSRT